LARIGEGKDAADVGVHELRFAVLLDDANGLAFERKWDKVTHQIDPLI
jgi:hypothetical protein